jgi:hypothetical protein
VKTPRKYIENCSVYYQIQRGAHHPPNQQPKLKCIGKILPSSWIFMECSRVIFTFTAPWPTFNLLICTQGQTPVFWVALFECDLHFKVQWLLYLPSVLTFKILRCYVPCFRQPAVPRLQCAMKTRRQQQRRSVQLPMSSEIDTEYRYLAKGTEGRYEGRV